MMSVESNYNISTDLIIWMITETLNIGEFRCGGAFSSMNFGLGEKGIIIRINRHFRFMVGSGMIFKIGICSI